MLCTRIEIHSMKIDGVYIGTTDYKYQLPIPKEPANIFIFLIRFNRSRTQTLLFSIMLIRQRRLSSSSSSAPLSVRASSFSRHLLFCASRCVVSLVCTKSPLNCMLRVVKYKHTMIYVDGGAKPG